MNQVFASIIVSAAEAAAEPRTVFGLVALLISQLAAIITAIAVPVLAWLQFKSKQKADQLNAKIDAVSKTQTVTAAASLEKLAAVQDGVERTNNQVVNGHEKAPPFRVDFDEKFGALHGAVAGVQATVLAEADERRKADADIGERIAVTNERIGRIEQRLSTAGG